MLMLEFALDKHGYDTIKFSSGHRLFVDKFDKFKDVGWLHIRCDVFKEVFLGNAKDSTVDFWAEAECKLSSLVELPV
jgi:hypothetical protein